ncbi:hypothetical protein E2C01_072082 [Portunus trituberculatus]|uniref:Uncharacterized protein n=1 Tax=Portunus trituberculatus TaxID=210409 RepID=A0A5B7IA63_PORTR|nr:hypothetical protein [Portunus trituberculatus]
MSDTWEGVRQITLPRPSRRAVCRIPSRVKRPPRCHAVHTPPSIRHHALPPHRRHRAIRHMQAGSRINT